MDYCQKLIQLFESDASVDEIIDCACMMGPHEACSTRIELFVIDFLEDKEDELFGVCFTEVKILPTAQLIS